MSEHFISRNDAETDLLSCAAFLAERITSVDGHAEAMTAVVPQYLEQRNVDLAAELSNTVDDPFTREKLLTAVALKCAELDDYDYALQLADAIEEPGMRMEALERVALSHAAKGDFESGREIAAGLTHPGRVLVGIAVKQAAAGLDEAAAATIAEIDYPVAAVTALHEIGLQNLHGGEAAKAVDYLEKAFEKAKDIEHDEEKGRACCDIGNAFLEAGRNDRAITAFDLAKSTAETIDNMHRDVLLALAAQGFLRAGSVDLADRTLDLVTDKTQIASSLLGYSREFWRKDERTEAIESLEEAYAILESQHERETRDSRSRFRLFTQIAAQFAGFEMGERAIEIAEKIKDESERTSALAQIAAVLTIRGQDDEARHAFRAIVDDGDRALALIGMSDAMQKNGDREAAVELLNEAALLADGVPQLLSRSAAYTELAIRFARFEEEERFAKAIKNNLEVIATLKDQSAKVTALASVSALVHKLGLEIPEEERETIRSILN